MQAGQLNQRVTLQRPQATQSASGAIAPNFTTLRTVWGAFDFAGGREVLQGGGLRADLDAVVTIRWAPDLTAIDATWRVLDDAGAVFNVHSVVDVDHAHKEIQIRCRTGANHG